MDMEGSPQMGLMAGIFHALQNIPSTLGGATSVLTAWPLTANIDHALNGLTEEQLKNEIRFQRARELQLMSHINRMSLAFQAMEDTLSVFRGDLMNMKPNLDASLLHAPKKEGAGPREMTEALDVELIKGNCLRWQQYAPENVTIPRFLVRSVDGRVLKFRFMPDSAIALAGLDRASLSDFHKSFKQKIKNYLSRSAQADFEVYKDSYINMRNACDSQVKNYVPYCDVKKGIRLVSDVQLLHLVKMIRTESSDSNTTADDLNWITSVAAVSSSEN
eukprot:GILJ01001393.1.p1 GENE.GILJ01001393.1~~GILJ01001393.1.p1  ORF type:complete len:275 (+),score=55.44 GILJ01001393.1:80-904(+)